MLSAIASACFREIFVSFMIHATASLPIFTERGKTRASIRVTISKGEDKILPAKQDLMADTFGFTITWRRRTSTPFGEAVNRPARVSIAGSSILTGSVLRRRAATFVAPFVLMRVSISRFHTLCSFAFAFAFCVVSRPWQSRGWLKCVSEQQKGLVAYLPFFFEMAIQKKALLRPQTPRLPGNRLPPPNSCLGYLFPLFKGVQRNRN